MRRNPNRLRTCGRHVEVPGAESPGGAEGEGIEIEFARGHEQEGGAGYAEK